MTYITQLYETHFPILLSASNESASTKRDFHFLMEKYTLSCSLCVLGPAKQENNKYVDIFLTANVQNFM